jgi:hypothetical protein
MSEDKNKLMGFPPATVGEDPIITRERDTHLKHIELYRGVAAHMREWKFQAEQVDHGGRYPSYRYKLVRAAAKEFQQGQAIELAFGTYSVQRGKVHISGYWPQRGPAPHSASYVVPHDVRESSPSINVSLDRGYEVIARQIVTRFLPEYTRIWELIKAKIAQQDAYQNQMAENWKRIAESGLVVRAGRHQDEYRADVRIGVGADRKAGDLSGGYGDVRMSSSDSVQIELRSLPIETALRVLAALKGGK